MPGEPITARQLGKVHAVLSALGVTDRGEKLRVLSAVTYRQITSSRELTRDEAHVAIDVLGTVGVEQLAGLVLSGARFLDAAGP